MLFASVDRVEMTAALSAQAFPQSQAEIARETRQAPRH